MFDISATLKAIQEFFPHPIKILVTAFLLALASLFLPATYQARMGIQSFTAAHRVIEWGIVIALGVLLILILAEYIQDATKTDRWLKKRFKRLTPLEKNTIESLLINPDNPLHHWNHDPEVVYLSRDGILWKEETSPNGMCVFGLRNYVRDYLERHPLKPSSPKTR